MRGSVRLGRIAGIEIGVHYTWLFAFLLIAWSLAAPQGLFPAIIARQPVLTYWIMGVLAAVVLFVSVLTHELAHSLVARSRGLGVSSITLFIFGGVSNLQEEPKSASTEFIMAVVGPLSSLALGVVFWAIGLSAGVVGNPLFSIFLQQPQSTSVAAMLAYLSSINIWLGFFNLIPGFPLDGGRVLRSIVWGVTGSVSGATKFATTAGQVFAWAFIAYGVFQLFSGNWLGGLWIAFIGWFLNNAADSSRREVTLEGQFKGVRVREVMDSNPVSISPQAPVADVVRDIFLHQSRRAAAVSQDGRVAGIITLTDVKHLPQAKWAETPVSEIMTREPLYAVDTDDDLNAAFKLLAKHSLNQVLVLHGGQLVGVLSRADLIRYLQLSQELGLGAKK